MKGSVVCATLCAALYLAGCQESREDIKAPLSQKDFYKTIGEAIPFETGMEWIDNYKRTASEHGRTEGLLGYSVSALEMDALLASITNPIGVSFNYGTDMLGIMHIVLAPVDDSMALWSSIPGRIFVDANTGTEISQSIAYTWASAYQNAHPDDVWFHFFGKDIFDDMAALPYFSDIDIERGVNTLELTPELLLVIWNSTATVGTGRTMEYATVYDASNACPPCAVQ